MTPRPIGLDRTLARPSAIAALACGLALLGRAAGAEEAPAVVAKPEPFAPVVRVLGDATVNWTTLTIETHARSDRTMGAWSDRRVQEQDALDRVGPTLESLARSVPIRREDTLDAVLSADDPLAVRLDDGLRSWEVAETRYHVGGGVEMTARLNLLRWLAPLLDSRVGPSAAALPADGPTGLMIDARGLPFAPSVVPELRTAELKVLMSLEMLGKDDGRYAIPIVYVSDPADPRAVARLGRAPAFLRPVSAEASALVVGPGLPLTEGQLAQLVAARRVVIVADPTI